MKEEFASVEEEPYIRNEAKKHTGKNLHESLSETLTERVLR